VDVGAAQPLLVDSTDGVIHTPGSLIALAVEPQVLFTLAS
jgi:putative spermidine/putrescine transport system ATP-binding protein